MRSTKKQREGEEYDGSGGPADAPRWVTERAGPGTARRWVESSEEEAREERIALKRLKEK